MQPKTYDNPSIALLSIELELKSEKENAEVRVDNVEVCYFCLINILFSFIMRFCVCITENEHFGVFTFDCLQRKLNNYSKYIYIL